MSLPNFYNTVNANSVYCMWDGFNVANPNEIDGRLLLIGIFELDAFPHFDPVKAACKRNLKLEYVGGNISARSTVEGELVVDGIIPKVGDRILLYSQSDNTQNGIYTVEKQGTETTFFEISRVIDTSCNGDECVKENNSGKTVFVEEGSTLNSHTFQLMRYVCKGIGNTPLHFLDLSAEGFYSNKKYGARLIDSIASSDITLQAADRYTINVPNFISHSSPRLLKVLVPYNVDLDDVMESILAKDLTFNLVNGAVVGKNANGNINNCVCSF